MQLGRIDRLGSLLIGSLSMPESGEQHPNLNVHPHRQPGRDIPDLDR